jgi:hypothetical protein
MDRGANAAISIKKLWTLDIYLPNVIDGLEDCGAKSATPHLSMNLHFKFAAQSPEPIQPIM